MMPNRPDPASLPRAPDVAPALVGLAVAVATEADGDGVVFEPEVADESGDDNAVARVLVMSVGEEESEGALILLASAVALMLRVMPTGLQICCAKAMTSTKREFILVSTIAFLLSKELLG